MKAKDKKYKK